MTGVSYYSQAEKQLICTLIEKDRKAKEVSEALSISITNIYKWYAKFKNGESVEPNYSPGRKKILSSEEEEKLVLTIESNPELSNLDLAGVVSNKIAPRTISDYLLRQNPQLLEKLLPMKSQLTKINL